MKVMETSGKKPDKKEAEAVESANGKAEPGSFSPEKVGENEKVDPGDESVSKVVNGKVYGSEKAAESGITVTPEDKKAFIDAIVGNTRFTASYSLFGGSVELVLRSLTTEEAMAVASYCIKHSTTDVTGQVVGKYRKYLIAAHIQRYNSIVFEPLKGPLFDTIDANGAEKEPEWVNGESVKYWDAVHPAVVSAVAECVSNFEAKYEYLSKRAEDANFWNSDTP